MPQISYRRNKRRLPCRLFAQAGILAAADVVHIADLKAADVVCWILDTRLRGNDDARQRFRWLQRFFCYEVSFALKRRQPT